MSGMENVPHLFSSTSAFDFECDAPACFDGGAEVGTYSRQALNIIWLAAILGAPSAPLAHLPTAVNYKIAYHWESIMVAPDRSQGVSELLHGLVF